MAQIVGLHGKSVAIGTQDVILAQVDVFSDIIRDAQRLFVPEPHGLVVTFAAPNAPNAGVNLSAGARIEYGSGGLQNVIGPINVYPGMSLSVHGSWCRVVGLGAAGGPREIGAFVSFGETVLPAETLLFIGSITAGETRQVTFDGRSANAAGALLTPTYVSGLAAIRVSGADGVGAFPPVVDSGPDFRVIIGDAVNFVPQEIYNITPGGTDVWHDIGQQVSTIFNQNQVFITNNSPNTAVYALHGRWNA